MTWTREKPKEVGWYWVRFPLGKRDRIVEVSMSQGVGRLYATEFGLIEDQPDKTLWSGPIPEPEDSTTDKIRKGGE